MNIMQKINDDLLAKQAERLTREGSGKFSPSLLGRCYRMQVWKRKGEPQTNPPDVRALRIFAVGHLFHEYIQSQLEGVEKEVKVETDDILGFADLVTEDEVIDIKTQHSRAFWYMQKGKYDVNKEKYPNILQVMTYAYLLGKPKGRLIFISKDDLCTEEYGFHLDQWKGKVEEEIATLLDWWSKELPPC